MKKEIVVILLLLSTFFTGCEVKNDYVFDDISATRITKYIDTCRQVLGKAPHGWKFIYSPDSTQYGIYTFLMKFKEHDRVEMAWDGSEEVTESSFGFNASRGPILSFNTYSVLHMLADPSPEVMQGKPGMGLNGEFEFMIQNVEEDKIEFLSKKNKKKVVFVRATAEDWDELAQCREMDKRFEFDRSLPFYHYLELNGETALFLYSKKLRMVYMVYSKGGSNVAESFPYQTTARGIKFDHPVTMAGITFSEVTIDDKGVMSIVDASEKGRFFRAENDTEACLVRLPGSLEASRLYDGYNLVEYGPDMDVLFPAGKPVEEFRFYWNLAGMVGLEFMVRPESGIATYAAKYIFHHVDDGVGDQVMFERTVYVEHTGAITMSDQMFYELTMETSVLKPLFANEAGWTVLTFGRQTFLVRNNNSLAWGLCSSKESRY